MKNKTIYISIKDIVYKIDEVVFNDIDKKYLFSGKPYDLYINELIERNIIHNFRLND
jgi:hypothetical protein